MRKTLWIVFLIFGSIILAQNIGQSGEITVSVSGSLTPTPQRVPSEDYPYFNGQFTIQTIDAKHFPVVADGLDEVTYWEFFLPDKDVRELLKPNIGIIAAQLMLTLKTTTGDAATDIITISCLDEDTSRWQRETIVSPSIQAIGAGVTTDVKIDLLQYFTPSKLHYFITKNSCSEEFLEPEDQCVWMSYSEMPLCLLQSLLS